MRAIAPPLLIVVSSLLAGCYAEGHSHFLDNGELQRFMTMDRCESEAKATHSDGSPRYSGFVCTKKFTFFELERREFYEGKEQRSSPPRANDGMQQ